MVCEVRREVRRLHPLADPITPGRTGAWFEVGPDIGGRRRRPPNDARCLQIGGFYVSVYRLQKSGFAQRMGEVLRMDGGVEAGGARVCMPHELLNDG